MTLLVNSDDPSAEETSRLLPGKSTADENDTYGSTTNDCENGHVESFPAIQERLYSKSFIAKVVVALLIGKFPSVVVALDLM